MFPKVVPEKITSLPGNKPIVELQVIRLVITVVPVTVNVFPG
jgi:hypothetical protein